VDGLLVVLVPQSPSLFGTVDTTLGHKRRFARESVEQLLADQGLSTERVYDFNKIGKPAWWIFGRLLRRNHVNKVTLKLFDKSVWFWRHVDSLLPWHGLSLIVVARKRQDPAPESQRTTQLNAVTGS
jgi:hypothetical protein